MDAVFARRGLALLAGATALVLAAAVLAALPLTSPAQTGVGAVDHVGGVVNDTTGSLSGTVGSTTDAVGVTAPSQGSGSYGGSSGALPVRIVAVKRRVRRLVVRGRPRPGTGRAAVGARAL
jgi:hypothetical protein